MEVKLLFSMPVYVCPCTEVAQAPMGYNSLVTTKLMSVDVSTRREISDDVL